MDVLLKPELEHFVSETVKTGRYADVNAVVNEALEVLMEQEQFTPEHEAYLRVEVRRGLEQLDRGERAQFTAEQIIAEERQRLVSQRSGG